MGWGHAKKTPHGYVLEEYYAGTFREKLAAQIVQVFFDDKYMPVAGKSANNYAELMKYYTSYHLKDLKKDKINDRDNYVSRTIYERKIEGAKPFRVNEKMDISNLSGEAIIRLMVRAGVLKALEDNTADSTKRGNSNNLPVYDRDYAMNIHDQLGGIDLNSTNFNLQIKRNGRGVPLPLSQQDMAQLSLIQGFVPVILEIKPAVDLPILSELKKSLP